MNQSSKKRRMSIKNTFSTIQKKFQRLSKKELIILILYFIFISIINFHHELSQDEVQSFLIARDLSYIDMIKQTIYEGHSFFWSFLISPFAKLGLSADSQKIIPLTIATITAYLILKKAPFKLYLKTLLIFSSGMIYYYSSFARPYCMIIFLLVLIATTYEKRKEHPYLYVTIIGLLANTHAIMLPTVGLLILYFYYDVYKKKDNLGLSKKEKIISIIITTILLSIPLIIYFLGYFYCDLNNELTIKDYLKALKNKYQKNYSFLIDNYFRVLSKNFLIFTLCCTCFIAVHFLWLMGLKKNLKYGILFWIQYQFIIFIHSTFWFPIPTRIHLFTFFLMFWLWMCQYENTPKKSINFLKISLVILIIITIPETYKIAFNDILNRHSDGKCAAEFIKKNIPKNSVFISISNDYSQLIAGYLDKNDYKIYMPNQERFTTFCIWDYKYPRSINAFNIDKAVKKLKKEYENIYILESSTTRMKSFPVNNLKKYNSIELEKIYTTNAKTMMDKKEVCDLIYFKIYKITN